VTTTTIVGPSRRTRDYVSTTAYVGSAWLLGIIHATAGGFPIASAEWFGASLSGLVFGALFGWIRSLFGPTSIPRWIFWYTLVAVLLVGVIGRSR
jgi:hypothetical protein